MMKWFNLNDEEKLYARNRVNCCVVIYDIPNDKRRLKLSKLLEGYGVRVQKSCFEVKLEDAEYKQLLEDLYQFYSASDSDNICVYRSKGTEPIRLNATPIVAEEQSLYFL